MPDGFRHLCLCSVDFAIPAFALLEKVQFFLRAFSSSSCERQVGDIVDGIPFGELGSELLA